MSLDPVASLLAAVVVLLIGTLINRRVAFLSKYNIPDPITGGLLFAVCASVILAASGFKLGVDQTIKPLLLLMFFAGVGMCADLRMLKQGGKALAIFLLVLFPYILVQNSVGVSVAMALDLHPIFGLVGGSITLVGGHGTGAAYAERFSEVNNLQSVMELSMTAATIGLIVGGIIAGPVAQYLISKYKVRTGAAAGARLRRPGRSGDAHYHRGGDRLPRRDIRRGRGGQVAGGASPHRRHHDSLLSLVHDHRRRHPQPRAVLRIRCDDRASDLISGVCLSLFLVMTMMALDLVDVALSAGPLLLMIAAQVVFIALYAVYVCFRFMGRDYEAAVTSAAFIGFSMGSTATAMANMQAITGKYGPAPKSYLIVPLAGAFFIDLMNVVVLTSMLALPFMGG